MTRTPAFDDAQAREAWNRGARAWEEFVESGADYYRHEVHGPGLLAACEPVAGLDALDLGCGQGFFARALARRGAKVHGVDISDEQVAFARLHEESEPLGIRYHRMSAADAHQRWPEPAFDLVAACMSLQDMPDPGAALHSAHRVLHPGGRMVFSLIHPCADTPFREWEQDDAGNKVALKIDRYFDSGPATVHWDMARLSYHWDTPYWRLTLSEWSGLIAEAGFLIRRLLEPRPTEEQVARVPELAECLRLPTCLIFDLVKPAAPAGDSG